MLSATEAARAVSQVVASGQFVVQVDGYGLAPVSVTNTLVDEQPRDSPNSGASSSSSTAGASAVAAGAAGGGALLLIVVIAAVVVTRRRKNRVNGSRSAVPRKPHSEFVNPLYDAHQLHEVKTPTHAVEVYSENADEPHLEGPTIFNPLYDEGLATSEHGASNKQVANAGDENYLDADSHVYERSDSNYLNSVGEYGENYLSSVNDQSHGPEHEDELAFTAEEYIMADSDHDSLGR